MTTPSTFLLAAQLGHQGGWDEALLVITPMAVVGWLLWVAKRRMERRAVDRPSEPLDPGAD